MKITQWIAVFFLLLNAAGCSKFLEKPTDKQLVIPIELRDLQALLDSHNSLIYDPPSGQISCDDYYLTREDIEGLSVEEDGRMYLWEKDGLFHEGTDHWLRPYRNVYYANTVLERIVDMPRDSKNQTQWDNIKGQALFLRARSFLSAGLIWSFAYDGQTASTDLGIPIRLTADYNVKSKRASVKETYDQVILDLKTAAELLPVTPVHVNRASQPAAFGLLARTYLFMRDYESCLVYADRCLKLKNDLLDYNELNEAATYPFIQANKEVIYNSILGIKSVFQRKVDTLLYGMYDEFDLRKQLFFDQRGENIYRFKGSYNGNSIPFSGLAVDEVYLMRAEANARLGNVDLALDDLNLLLSSRHKEGKYTQSVAGTGTEVLELILLERRKELLMRGLRWPDIKRQNAEGANITLKRIIKGKEYVLPPNDLRYALPIPEDIIQLSGMQQNPR